jgi:branched-chain amino acid aminotransferase
MIVWLNDALINAEEMRIDPADRGFLLGDGLFETIAVRTGKILRLESHLARLKLGCEVLSLPYPSLDFKTAIEALCVANDFTDAAIRLTLTRGPAPRGLLPPEKPQLVLLISAASWPGAPPPARCVIATVTRRNEYSPLASIKSVDYLDNILARQEAAKRGANEAILLNTKGRVAESSAANLFVVKEGRMITPPVEEGALPGVMRAAVLNAYKGIQAPLEVGDLAMADAIFLTNSLGIRAVTSLEGKSVGNGARAFMEDVRTKVEGG